MEMFNFQIFLTVTLLVVLQTPLIISQLCGSEKVDIMCDNFSTIEHFKVGRGIRTCNSKNSLNVITPNASVSSVVPQIKSDVTKLDWTKVHALWILDSSVKFIPSGIKNHLPKLSVLKIHRSGLLRLKKENLKEFGIELQHLDLWNNEISTIDADLFEYNTNLKYVNLKWNKFRFIAPQFFENLKSFKNLAVVEFNPAGCINQDCLTSTSIGHSMSTFKWNIATCTDMSAIIETEKLVDDFILSCSQKKLDNTDNTNVTIVTDEQQRLIALENVLENATKSMIKLVKYSAIVLEDGLLTLENNNTSAKIEQLTNLITAVENKIGNFEETQDVNSKCPCSSLKCRLKCGKNSEYGKNGKKNMTSK